MDKGSIIASHTHILVLYCCLIAKQPSGFNPWSSLQIFGEYFWLNSSNKMRIMEQLECTLELDTNKGANPASWRQYFSFSYYSLM